MKRKVIILACENKILTEPTKMNGRHLLEKFVIRAEELGSCIMRQDFREMAANQLNQDAINATKLQNLGC